MNIVKRLDQYNENYIYFCDPIKNNVMCEGNFIRILYSTNYVVFNGIYLLLQLNDVIFEKYYNKYKCIFNVNTHNFLIDKIKNIEENILKKISLHDKQPQFKIYEQIKNGNIKIFGDNNLKNNSLYTLKISGIWETQNNYGLTYKFIKINNS
jgi:hypothetical protein